MSRREAFTLVELLVVIAVIAGLIAVLIPAVMQARESARKVGCSNKLRQQGLALLNYESASQKLPSGAESVTGHSWVNRVLPYLDEEPLERSVDFQLPWNHQSNSLVAQTTLELFRCPSSSKAYAGSTDYCGISGTSINVKSNAGRNGVLFPTSRWHPAIKIRDIRDGTSKTITVSENANVLERNHGYWACGFSCLAHDDGPVNNRVSNVEIASHHSRGAFALFADGSTHFLSDSIAVEVIGALCTRSNHADVQFEF